MTSPVQVGDVLVGKYRVERILGVGGMGVVVAAMHLQLDQLVALKFMLPEVLKNANHVARFLREARAVVRLKGEHVARVLDVGTLETGAPYIVMEFLEGEDLAGTLARRGPLPIGEACDYVLQACEAMAEAHALEIVHRDLKPQNLFLTRRPDGTPFVKVLDFGISKTNLVAEQGFEATQTSTMMGSPQYMSPEQVRSAKDVDPRTDIWALGVILYQLVSGRVPFTADTVVQLCVQVLHSEPAPLDVPVDLGAVVARCLRKDREERHANIAELVAELAAFVPRTGPETLERVSRLLQVPPRRSVELPTPVPSVPLTQPTVKTTLGGAAGASVNTVVPSKSRWLAPAAILGGAILIAAVVVATRSPGQAPAASPPSNASQTVAIDAAVAVDVAVTAVVADAPPIPSDTATDAARIATEPARPNQALGRPNPRTSPAPKPPVRETPPALPDPKPDPVVKPVLPEIKPDPPRDAGSAGEAFDRRH